MPNRLLHGLAGTFGYAGLRFCRVLGDPPPHPLIFPPPTLPPSFPRPLPPPASPQLMQHPLMQQRLRGLTYAMDALAVAATPMGTSLTRPRPGAPPGPHADCQVALTFVQAACLLLPLVALAWQHPSQRQQQERQVQQEQQRQVQQEQQRQQPAALPANRGAEAMRGAWRWADRTLRGAWRWADSTLHTLCLAHVGGAARAAWLCWLMPVLWLLARALTNN